MLSKNLIRYIVASAIGVVAIAAGATSYGVLKVQSDINNNKHIPTAKELEQQFLWETFGDKVNKDYGFVPETFKLAVDQNDYASADYATLNAALGGDKVTYETTERQDADGKDLNIVYYFEGFTAEGWQGDYSPKKAFLTLWSDGIYVGNSNGTRITGYWYNVDSEGNDCLMLKAVYGNKASNAQKNDMVCNKTKGDSYYQYDVDVLAEYNGGRMIKASGFAYYPVVAMYIDTGDNDLKFSVGEEISTTGWTAKNVRGGGETIFQGGIFDAQNAVKYTFPDTSTAGEAEVTAKWGEFTATVKVTIE